MRDHFQVCPTLLAGFAFLASAPLALAQSLTFVEVTAVSGLDIPLTPNAPGIAVGDFDGDGWEDVVITGAMNGSPQFFHNRQNILAAGGSGPLFMDVTSHVMPAGAHDASASVFADIDNDGDSDLVISRRFINPITGYPTPKHTGVEFFINEDYRRTFKELGADENLGRDPTPHGGLTLGDADLDGDLDVIFTHNGGGNGIGGPGFYLRNGPGLTFSDETVAFGANIANTVTRYFSTVLFDFNADLWPDMHSSVDFFTDVHCRNMGNGSFQNVSQQVGTTNTGSDMGLTVGDPDMDGDFDVYSTNINIGIFYENDGAGHFNNTATSHGISSFNHGLTTCVGWGTAFVDFDLDMDEDLVVVGSLGKGELFLNNGTGQFTRVGSGSGLQLLGRSLVPVDFDHDGDMDLLVGHEGPATTVRLWENVTPSTAGRHWIAIDPVGSVSNADGVGCHVEVKVGDTVMHRAIVIGSSFKSGLPLSAHFGTGNATLVDEIKVHWPSGTVTSMFNVPVDQLVKIVE
ncbi:MAG: hypothetical protein ACI8X5_003485 [Planctomycetota bacterium]|jgi:hypothetical protein